jgi:hypothetical protein
VRHILRQRVLENVNLLSHLGALVEELLPLKVQEMDMEIGRLANGLQQLKRHLATDNGRDLQESLRRVGKPVYARLQYALNGIRDR